MSIWYNFSIPIQTKYIDSQYFLILYQGFHPNRYYWEYVNTLRKASVLISILLPDSLTIGFTSTILITTSRLQLRLKPYKNEENNKAELLAINSGIFTILSSFIFSEEDKMEIINNIVLIILILFNWLFLIRWFLLLLYNFKKYKTVKVVRVSVLIA